ncbi:hypothetical protein CEXT_361401 [Caerostris extrusa]|uniref:Uncharacterized protein n=1 Tax=Caerostris extrusa TaxID=172846 RepID=A0AAV4NIC6_CAEEX|nr:hypothetical protein CEXT_361401 [Caerostris extrusa]
MQTISLTRLWNPARDLPKYIKGKSYMVKKKIKRKRTKGKKYPSIATPSHGLENEKCESTQSPPTHSLILLRSQVDKGRALRIYPPCVTNSGEEWIEGVNAVTVEIIAK